MQTRRRSVAFGDEMSLGLVAASKGVRWQWSRASS